MTLGITTKSLRFDKPVLDLSSTLALYFVDLLTSVYTGNHIFDHFSDRIEFGCVNERIGASVQESDEQCRVIAAANDGVTVGIIHH